MSEPRWLNREQQQWWRAYVVGTTLLMERLDRELRERHDLSLPEYEILVRLSESPSRSLRMAAVAESVKNSRSRVTHTVGRLERDGLVERTSCPSDGRGVVARLTDAGFARLQAAAPDHVESVRESLVDVLDDTQLAAVGRAFAAVVQRLEHGQCESLLGPVETAVTAQRTDVTAGRTA